MLNPTTHELIFIRICIFLLTYAPFFYAILPPFFSIPALLAELAYYIFILRPFEARLRTHRADHPPDTRQERQALFKRCLENIPDPESYLSVWALRADVDEIKRENVRDFFLWAFLDREDAQGSDVEDELEWYIAKTEELLGRPLVPGSGIAKPMRLTFDVVETRYRTAIWYTIVGLVDSFTHLRMLWKGFEFYSTPILTNLLHVFPPRPLASLERLRRQSPSDELSVWHRPGTDDSTLPILFLHGIGIGLYPYVEFLGDLPPTSSVLAVEILPICMRLTTSNILARPDFIRHLKEILHHYKIDRFVLVGHSYGSALASQVLHDSELGLQAEAVVLIDPVSLLLHLPDVAYNFTRRKPRTANEWQLWYMASMDPGVAFVLGRHFFWRENIISKEELVDRGGSKRKAAVCLASRDLIVDTLSVARYLIHEEGLTDLGRRKGLLTGDEKLAGVLDKGYTETGSGVELLWFPMDHSQVFDKKKDYGRILEVVWRFCVYP